MTSARKPVTMNTSRMPAPSRPLRICSRIGLPCTLSMGLGNSFVSSRIRVPLPAAKITAFISIDSRRIIRGLSQRGKKFLPSEAASDVEGFAGETGEGVDQASENLGLAGRLVGGFGGNGG